jgi:hypothetical protein
MAPRMSVLAIPANNTVAAQRLDYVRDRDVVRPDNRLLDLDQTEHFEGEDERAGPRLPADRIFAGLITFSRVS